MSKKKADIAEWEDELDVIAEPPLSLNISIDVNELLRVYDEAKVFELLAKLRDLFT